MSKAHRDGDSRNCGAVTVVTQQSSVFVNGKLWAVRDSINSHGSGGLINSGTTVTINGLPVIVHAPDNAQPDDLCPPLGGNHCNPQTSEGSDNVFAY